MDSDILAFFDEFYEYGKFEKSLNASSIPLISKKHKASKIYLIPKKQKVSKIRNFRLITRLSSVYKMLSEVLAYWLRGVLDGLISESHNAFVGGFQILDSILVANDCVNSRICSKIPGVIYKLDMEKVYNHVN